jgi:hypothetical protein
MTPSDIAVLRLVADDPARRRRLLRRAAVEAVRRRLRGPTGYRVAGTSVVVSVAGQDVARYDPWAEGAAHD